MTIGRLIPSDPSVFSYLVTWDVVQAFTDAAARDRIFCATNDGTGNVFEMDRGNSLYGYPIRAYAVLVPDVSQVPYLNKRFSGINIFSQVQDYATFLLSRVVNYKAAPSAMAEGTFNPVAGISITETYGSTTANSTGITAPAVTYGTSPLQAEGTAITLRFDYADRLQYPHTIQAISYNIDKLNEKAQ